MVEIKKSPEVENVEYKITRDDLGVFNDFISGIGTENRNLDLFYINIKDVKIYMNNQRIFFNNQPLAEYSPIFNIILCSKKNYKIGIMHELLHMASSYRGESGFFGGFRQQSLDLNDSIGVGLNEGYTALLDDRYFKNYDPKKEQIIGKTYPILKILASYIEDIIGVKNMEDCYFRADLYSIYIYFARFMGEEETINFIKNIDDVFENCDGVGRKLNLNNTMKAYQECIRFLGIAQLMINNKLLLNDLISEDIYTENLIKIIKIFKSELRFLGKYNLPNDYAISDDEIQKILTLYTDEKTLN